MRNIHSAKLMTSIVYFFAVTMVFWNPWDGTSSFYSLYSTFSFVFAVYTSSLAIVGAIACFPLIFMGQKITRLGTYVAKGKFLFLIVIYFINSDLNGLLSPLVTSSLSEMPTENLRVFWLLMLTWLVWAFDDFCTAVTIIARNERISIFLKKQIRPKSNNIHNENLPLHRP